MRNKKLIALVMLLVLCFTYISDLASYATDIKKIDYRRYQGKYPDDTIINKPTAIFEIQTSSGTLNEGDTGTVLVGEKIKIIDKSIVGDGSRLELWDFQYWSNSMSYAQYLTSKPDREITIDTNGMWRFYLNVKDNMTVKQKNGGSYSNFSDNGNHSIWDTRLEKSHGEHWKWYFTNININAEYGKATIRHIDIETGKDVSQAMLYMNLKAGTTPYSKRDIEEYDFVKSALGYSSGNLIENNSETRDVVLSGNTREAYVNFYYKKKMPIRTDTYVDVEAIADPSSIQFKNEDMLVKVPVKGSLKNFDLANKDKIQYWILFVRLKGTTNWTMKVVNSKEITAEHTFDIPLNKSIMNGKEEHSQIFEVKANVYIDGLKSNYIDSAIKEVLTYIYKVKPAPPAPPAPALNPPIANISGPTIVEAGETAMYNGAGSYAQEPDAEIEEYLFYFNIFNNEAIIREGTRESNTYVDFLEIGEFDLFLEVADSFGNSDYTSHRIKVIPPVPTAIISANGAFKQYRRITLDGTLSKGNNYYPINWSNSYWEISNEDGTPIEGLYLDAPQGNVTFNNGKVRINSIQKFNILTTEAKNLNVMLHVKNTYGNSGETRQTLDIRPDAPPVADYSTINTIYRDPENENKGRIVLNDASYSNDGDIISSKKWNIYYNDNNGGIEGYNDDPDITYSASWNLIKTIEQGELDKNLEVEVEEVGKYKVEIEVTEDFGQETFSNGNYTKIENGTVAIKTYNKEKYKRSGNSNDKNIVEKIIEVRNIAPNVSFDVRERKKVDIVFNVADTEHKNLMQLENLINTKIKPNLDSNFIDYNIKVVDSIPKAFNKLYYIGFSRIIYADDYADRYYLYEYDPITNTHTEISELSNFSNLYSSTQVASDGRVYFYDRNRRINVYDPKTKGISIIVDSSSNSFAVGLDGKIYYATTTTFRVYDPVSNTHFQGRNYYTIYNLQVDLQGRVYFQYQNEGNANTYVVRYNHQANTYTQVFSVINGAKFTLNPNGRFYYLQFVSNGILHFETNYFTLGTTRTDGNVSFLVSSRTADEVFFNYSPDAWNNNTRRGFYKWNSTTNVFTEILSSNVQIYTVTPDNKVYYRKVTDHNRALFVYNPETGSHTNLGLIPSSNTSIKEGVGYSMNITSQSYPTHERLDEIEWRDGAKRLFVDIRDVNIQNQNELNNLLTNLIGSDAYYLNLGKASTKVQAENLIKQNDDKGIFINNTNLENALNDLTNYVTEMLLNEYDLINLYALVDTDLDIITFYDDKESDPMYSDRWKVTHLDPTFFENSNGVMANSGQYISTMLTSFNKVGLYDVLYEARDNPKTDSRFDNYKLTGQASMKLYIHRRPIAKFFVNLVYNQSQNNFTVGIIDQAYDLDHMSKFDRGIVETRWRYKELGQSNWIEGIPTTLPRGKKYIIYQQVRDREGEWSLPSIVEVDTNNIKPTINATPEKTNGWLNRQMVTANGDLKVRVLATAYSGKTISEIEYSWSKFLNTPGTWTRTTQNNFDLTRTQNGMWYLHLKTKDSGGLISDPYVAGIYMIDKLEPIITATETEKTDEKVTLNINVTDDGGSQYKETKYKWSQSSEKPTTGWITTTASNFSTSQTNDGMWYLHIESYDNAGNPSYRRLGGYNIIVNKPPTVQITGIKPIVQYEGDDIYVSFKPSDPDFDTLTGLIELFNSSNQKIFAKTITIHPNGNNYNTITEKVASDIGVGNYRVEVTVTDPFNEKDKKTETFTVRPLGIVGAIDHTPQWELNRKKYNVSKSGNENIPRSYDMFFPGERFMINATTTTINSLRLAEDNLRVVSVRTNLLGTFFFDNLRNSSPTIWNGSIWDSSMTRWNNRTLEFEFIATYSNGTVKKDRVQVKINNDPYWRQHIKF